MVVNLSEKISTSGWDKPADLGVEIHIFRNRKNLVATEEIHVRIETFLGPALELFFR